VIVVACLTTAVLAGAAPASATVDLTAIGTRVGDHPAFVRVVVDFTDSKDGVLTCLVQAPVRLQP
jgi:hypothetical protein